MSNLFPSILLETEISDWRERLEKIWHELYQEKNNGHKHGKDFTDVVEQVFSRHLPVETYHNWKPHALDDEKTVLNLLEDGKEELDKYVSCELVLAKSLSYSVTEQIKKIISSQINQKIVLKISIDPSLGCGFIVNWDGRVQDYSIRSLVNFDRLCKQCIE